MTIKITRIVDSIIQPVSALLGTSTGAASAAAGAAAAGAAGAGAASALASAAGAVILGRACNGRKEWKDSTNHLTYETWQQNQVERVIQE